MSNFVVQNVYSYSSASLYHYLGVVPSTSQELQNAFRDFNVTPRGNVTDDLQRLNKAMYSEYTKQVQNIADNQNKEENVPWASVCKQIGVEVTGDYEKDRTAFNNAINLLSQSAIDGQAMTYFAGLKTEASLLFNKSAPQQEAVESYNDFVYNALR